jgi:oxygen-dependent protoporphyrinogen oxidase
MADSLPAVVVGAGISGLVCACALRQAGIDAEVFEASERPGGLIQSARQGGFLLELGPQSFTATEPIRRLSQELGLASQAAEAPPRAPRFVLLNGELRPAPLSPPAFFFSSFVGAATKWALVRDIVGTSKPPASEESVAAFTRRKFSEELLEKLVGPFVSGIYAGDAEKLSLRAAFPQLYAAESTAGSVVRGVLRATKQNRQPEQQRTTLQTFVNGNETLTQALADRLGAALHLGDRVAALRPAPEASAWTVHVRTADTERTLTVRNVVLALPTNAALALLSGLSQDLTTALNTIEYAPVAVVSLGYRRADVGHDLNGFGFLVPRSAGLQTLGSVWNSSLFVGRALDGHVLMTSFVGGATNPGAVQLGAESLAGLVHRELAPILKLAQPPVFSHVTAHERAIPQYNLGHVEQVDSLEKAGERHPGLFLTGNYLRGPAIGACVEHAQGVAAQVVARLKS